MANLNPVASLGRVLLLGENGALGVTVKSYFEKNLWNVLGVDMGEGPFLCPWRWTSRSSWGL
eukprot:JP448837.1.p1 GENE.JP448837.1~~JP448837.1.p1  ORF type:complete len:70 (+),score=4.00 JP448837.1:25-210(+)